LAESCGVTECVNGELCQDVNNLSLPCVFWEFNNGNAVLGTGIFFTLQVCFAIRGGQWSGKLLMLFFRYRQQLFVCSGQGQGVP
jgi:hypothetical protein